MFLVLPFYEGKYYKIYVANIWTLKLKQKN